MAGRPIAVAQMVGSLSVGGAERVAVLLANGMARRGLDSHLVATRRLGPLEEALDAEVRVWCAGKRHTLGARYPLRIARYVDRHGIDVVHSHSHTVNYSARKAQWLARRKFVHVAHDHSGGGAGGRLRAFLDWAFLRHVDAYVSVTESLHERALRLLDLPAGRCLYVRNGVEVGSPAPPWSGPPTVAQVANVHPRKDYATAVRAAAILRRSWPDLAWRAAGAFPAPDYAEQVRGLAQNLGVADAFLLIGAREDVRPLLREAHVGVLSSVGEGLPLAVLEYMAEGLPVVLTDVGQAPALLREAEAGIVVPPRDPEAMAEAVGGLLADADRGRALGENGRRLVSAEYSMDAMTDRVVALYEELLAGRPEGGTA